jgi:hypothetical protein
MSTAFRRLLALCLALCAAIGSAAPARAEAEVDVALVLAVDVSRSMDDDEQRLQRDGFVEAFRSQVVHEAIRKGTIGRIGVVYMEWSGPGQQSVVVPWTLLDGSESAIGFAERLARQPVGRIYSTSISGAIDFGLKLHAESRLDPLRRVIDVSGDGPNNTGRPVTAARDEAVAQGVTINGLPFMVKRPTGFGDIEDLDLYYQDCVIGGPGAFIVPVREAAEVPHADAAIHLAQDRARSDCEIGEKQRRQRFGP